MRWTHLLLGFQIVLASTAANAGCPLLHPSNGAPPAGSPVSPAQSLNENFPTAPVTVDSPWLKVNFKTDPQGYAELIRQAAKATIHIQSGKIQIDNTYWWTVPLMNYTNNGREYFNGMTKERTPKAKDLSPNSPNGAQVWAVGWYNALGASQFAKIWSDPCQPDLSMAALMPQGTMSVKMLFTTAPASGVPNLQGAPEVQAAIDPGAQPGPPSARVAGTVRLLQVDFAVKDSNSDKTGWVFGTFAWIAPSTGDGVWDSLQLVGLHWGNDPGLTSNLVEGWMNPAMNGKTYGWPERPFMGFAGRVNGPADNKTSACLSCHSRSQMPRAAGPLAPNTLPNMQDKKAVKTYLDTYFRDIPAGGLNDPQQPNAVALDYSLQVMNSFERHCAACAAGDVSGAAPKICKLVGGTETTSQCAGGVMEAFRNITARPALRALLEGPPDRQ